MWDKNYSFHSFGKKENLVVLYNGLLAGRLGGGQVVSAGYMVNMRLPSLKGLLCVIRWDYRHESRSETLPSLLLRFVAFHLGSDHHFSLIVSNQKVPSGQKWSPCERFLLLVFFFLWVSAAVSIALPRALIADLSKEAEIVSCLPHPRPSNSVL